MTILHVRTETLDIAYLDVGQTGAPAALLLHGWPDDATTWLEVAEQLAANGIRCVIPWLRGCGGTKFLAAATIRDGRTEALAQDALDLVDALGIDRFAAVGHDWGARAVYALAALAPERVTKVAALSLGYSPRGEFHVPPLEQARAWWYQWFMCADAGADFVRRHPKAFARMQWDTWSPRGWFAEATFDQVARSFENPDWVAITLSSYRARWQQEAHDARYDAATQRIGSTSTLDVPTLVIHGSADACVLASSSEGREGHFTAGYRRVVVDGAGHFLPREAPGAVADLIRSHLA
jgi:pimeloyl-ACP methyl ester carboxylesterase